MLFVFFFPLQNSLHRLPGSVVGHKVWANAHTVQEALVGAVVENDTFPVESGTLRLTALLPPCSLSSSGGPGFLAVGGQEDEKKKKEKREKRKPLLPQLGRVLLGGLWGAGSG